MRFVVQITKGILRDQHSRRMTMFVVVLVALVMLFSGSTFLNRMLLERPLVFIGYWFACAWLTLTAVLLALFDMLILRSRARAERRRLRREIFEEHNGEE